MYAGREVVAWLSRSGETDTIAGKIDPKWRQLQEYCEVVGI